MKTMDIHPFQTIVKERCGLCFEAEKAATLSDSIRSRMSQRGIASDSEYLACLRGDDDEFHCLVNLITINETYFFRESAHLDLLANRLFNEMLALTKPGVPIRILCAGCATGEEPYSVMMKLQEKYGTGIRSRVSIIGADIDSIVLRSAEQGVYGGRSFRGFPQELREKYFMQSGKDQYAIRTSVKERVRFMRLNLMHDVYPEELYGMDVIFYRNVSIYFEPETQKRIFEKLASLLKEKGWLFVSSTETLSHNHGSLSLIELDNVFCYQKNIEVSLGDRRKSSPNKYVVQELCAMGNESAVKCNTVSPSANTIISAKNTVHPTAGSCLYDKPRSNHSSFEEALVLAKNKSYSEALNRINGFLEANPAFTKGYMLKAGILINMKRFSEAEQVCHISLERDRWSLESYLLLGFIAKVENNEELAIKRFKEALYIQPSCWLAHFYMAEIFCLRCEGKKALREYEIVLKLLQKDDLTDHGLTFFPLAFPIEQIIHLCQHNITKLKHGKK